MTLHFTAKDTGYRLRIDIELPKTHPTPTRSYDTSSGVDKLLLLNFCVLLELLDFLFSKLEEINEKEQPTPCSIHSVGPYGLVFTAL